MKKKFTVYADDRDDAIAKLEQSKKNIILTNLLESISKPTEVITELVSVEFIED